MAECNARKEGCLDTVPAWGCAMINIPWYTYLLMVIRHIGKKIEQMIAYHKYASKHHRPIHNDHKYPLMKASL